MELARAAIRALGQTSGAVTAVSIAIAESSGYSRACVLDSNGYYSRGPWQINGVNSQFNNDGVYDLTANAHAMAVISKGGTDFGAWSTWPFPAIINAGRARLAVAKAGGKKGMAKCNRILAQIAHKNHHTKPTFEDIRELENTHPECAGNVKSDPFGGIPGADLFAGVAGAIQAFVHLIGALFRGSTWIRFGEGTLALFLFVLGIALIARDLGLSNVEELAKKAPGVSGGFKLAQTFGAK